MKYIWIVLVGLALIGAAFYGGMRFAQANRGNFFTGQRGQFRGLGNGPGGMGGAFSVGQVLNKDAQSITIKMRDGSSKIILLAPSTIISKSAAGSVDDIQTGKQVMVNGTPNPDGSISAQTIQIRPDLPQGQPSSSQQ